jgi:hypothetical protein
MEDFIKPVFKAPHKSLRTTVSNIAEMPSNPNPASTTAEDPVQEFNEQTSTAPKKANSCINADCSRARSDYIPVITHYGMHT